MLKVFVENVRDHTQDIGDVAICDFVFEVADDDRAEVVAHDIDCRAPIRRYMSGWSSCSDLWDEAHRRTQSD